MISFINCVFLVRGAAEEGTQKWSPDHWAESLTFTPVFVRLNQWILHPRLVCKDCVCVWVLVQNVLWRQKICWSRATFNRNLCVCERGRCKSRVEWDERQETGPLLGLLSFYFRSFLVAKFNVPNKRQRSIVDTENLVAGLNTLVCIRTNKWKIKVKTKCKQERMKIDTQFTEVGCKIGQKHKWKVTRIMTQDNQGNVMQGQPTQRIVGLKNARWFSTKTKTKTLVDDSAWNRTYCFKCWCMLGRGEMVNKKVIINSVIKKMYVRVSVRAKFALFK